MFFAFSLFILYQSCIFFYKQCTGDCLYKSVAHPELGTYFFSAFSNSIYLLDRFDRSYGIEYTSDITFNVYREKWFHRAWKKLGLASEISTGNKAVDSKLFFASMNPTGLQKKFENKDLAPKILWLFETHGIRGLYVSHNKIWIEPKQSVQDYNPNGEIIMVYLNAIRELADTLSRCPSNPTPNKSDHPAYVSISLSRAIFLTSFIIVMLFGLYKYNFVSFLPILIYAFTVWISISIIWLLLIFIYFLRTSWLPRILANFIFCLPFSLVFLFFILCFMNTAIDNSQPQIIPVQVVSKHCTLVCNTSYGMSSEVIFNLTDQQCLDREKTLAEFNSTYKSCQSHHDFKFYMQLEDKFDVAYKNSATAAQYEEAAASNAVNVNVFPGALGAAWYHHPFK